MYKRLELFLAALTDVQLSKVERAILELANHGETNIVFDKALCDIADDILNY